MSYFEFRRYGFYHGNRSIGYFVSGYIKAEGVDAAIKKLSSILCDDDYEWGSYLRKTGHVVDETRQDAKCVQYPGLQITGDFVNTDGKAPAWVYQDPKIWEQEGFVPARLIMQGNMEM